MKRSKLVCLSLSLLVSIGLLAGCGGEKKEAGKASETVLKIGHVEPEDRSIHKALLNFKKKVEERSKGSLKIEIYPNGALGGDVQLSEAVATGSLDMALPSTSVLTTYNDVPPTPGPLAAAGLLGIDLGQAIMWGAFAAVFMTLFGWIFAELYFRNKPESYYTFRSDEEQEKEMVQPTLEEDSNLPGTWASLLPLLLPIILILLNTSCSMLLPKGHYIRNVTSFIGDSNIALAIGSVAAIMTLGGRLGKEKVLKIMDKSLSDAGSIVFITAAGGALGAVLKQSHAGASLANLVINTGLPFILIPFVISGLLKIVQGSGTVAVVTAATLCAPIASKLGLNPILIFLASGAGARSCCHVNDSFFWVYTNCMGFDMKTGLRTLSISNVAMALGGLFATYIASLVL